MPPPQRKSSFNKAGDYIKAKASDHVEAMHRKGVEKESKKKGVPQRMKSINDPTSPDYKSSKKAVPQRKKSIDDPTSIDYVSKNRVVPQRTSSFKVAKEGLQEGLDSLSAKSKSFFERREEAKKAKDEQEAFNPPSNIRAIRSKSESFNQGRKSRFAAEAHGPPAPLVVLPTRGSVMAYILKPDDNDESGSEDDEEDTDDEGGSEGGSEGSDNDEETKQKKQKKKPKKLKGLGDCSMELFGSLEQVSSLHFSLPLHFNALFLAHASAFSSAGGRWASRTVGGSSTAATR